MFKNMNIQKRLITAFLIAIILSSIAGVLGVALLSKSDSDYSAVLENYGFAQGDLGNLGRAFQASRVINLYVATAPDDATRNAYLEELAVEDANIDKNMELVKANLGSALGQETYATLDAQMQDFRTARDDLLASTPAGGDASANIATYREKMADSSNTVRETLNAMIEDKSTIGYEKSAGLTQQASLFRIVMIAIIVAALVCALVLSVSIAHGISRPLVDIEKMAKKMSMGDFDVQIDYVSKDEVGLLSESMRQMTATTKMIIEDTSRGLNEIANGNFDVTPQVTYVGIFAEIESAIRKIIVDLSETLSQIKLSAEQVSSGSDQVSDGAQTLAQGATEQASSVQELSASINEVSEQIKDNAANAGAASDKADNVGNTIDVSNKQMVEMMSAMSEISSSSAEIGKIIKTIEDIAFQTNILALNAAVEAARAGAAGKGFAVVADEVRNLATKSSEAARQTNVLIESSVRSVDNGVKIADATAKSLAEVVSGAQEVISLIAKISQATTGQTTSISQINLGVEQISSVVQMNSATSEESAAASEELSGQANMMKQMISRFNLKNTPQNTPQSAAPKTIAARSEVQHTEPAAPSGNLF